MRYTERFPTGLLISTEKLRQLILEYPELPLAVVTGEYERPIEIYKGELLDCRQIINDERIYTDKEQFQADVEAKYQDEYNQDFINERLDEYEPYWKPCIILTLTSKEEKNESDTSHRLSADSL